MHRLQAVTHVRQRADGDVPRIQSNVIIDTSQPIFDNLNRMMVDYDAYPVFGQNGLRIEYERERTIDYSIPELDILDGISVEAPTITDRYNQVILRYHDEDNRYQVSEAVFPATNSALHIQWLSEDKGQELKNEDDLEVITNHYVALQKAQAIAYSSRDSLSVTFKVGTKGLRYEEFDLVGLNSELRGWTDKPFVIKSIIKEDDNTFTVTAVEYQPSGVLWTSKDPRDDYSDTDITDPFTPTVPANFVYTEELQDHTVSGVLTWDEPDKFVTHWVVQIDLDGTRIYETRVYDPSFLMPLVAADTYDVTVNAYNGSARSQATTTVTVAGVVTPTSNIDFSSLPGVITVTPPAPSRTTHFYEFRHWDATDATVITDGQGKSVKIPNVKANVTYTVEFRLITPYGSGNWEQISVDGVEVVKYTWIVYADDASGTGISNDPTGKAYFGIATNKDTPTPVLTPSLYQWISQAEGTTGEPASVVILSKDSHPIPADSDGNNGVYTNAATTVQVRIGSVDDTAAWTIGVVASAGITGSYNSTTKTYTVTNLSVDTGTVVFTCTRTGYATLTKEFTVYKVRKGTSGDAGTNGVSVAPVVIYKRSAGTPDTPGAGSFNFGTGVLTPPSGWSVTIPAGTDPVYSCHGVATSSTPTGTDSSIPWSTPAKILENGTTGSAGQSVFQTTIYRRATSTPATPTGGSYNFGTNVLTPPSGWSQSIPAGTDPVYSTTGTFSINGATGVATNVTWVAPVLSVKNGTDGDDGTNGVSTFVFPVYKRSASAPSTPTGGSFNFGTNTGTAPSGWSVTIPAGTDPLYISTSVASIIGDTGVDSTLTWAAPALMSKNGVDGNNGLSVAQLTIYKRSASAPTTPSGGSFNFGTLALTPPSGWSTTIPAGTDPVYSCHGNASIVGVAGTDSSIPWSTPLKVVQNGTDGAVGRSVYQAVIYRRATSTPATPSGGSFNFGTNVLTPPSGWSQSIPTGTDPVYATTGTFSISGDTGVASNATWVTPVLSVKNGTDGDIGYSTYFYSVFKRTAGTLTTPTGGSYNFGTQVGVPPSGWSVTVPDGTDPCYISSCVASVQGTTGVDSTLTWSEPTLLVKNGQDGLDGASSVSLLAENQSGIPGGETVTMVSLSIPAGTWDINIVANGDGENITAFNMAVAAKRGSTIVASDSSTSKYPLVSINYSVTITLAATTVYSVQFTSGGFSSICQGSARISASEVTS